MPQLGFNLLVWTASISEAYYSHIERIKKIGYDGIEICMGQQDTAEYKKLKGLLADLEMGITCVTVLDANSNPASQDPNIRLKAVDAIKWNIDRCHDCGSNILCGPIHSAFATFTRTDVSIDEYKRSADVLRTAGEYAQQADVTLCIEALNRFECYLCNTMEQLRGLVERVDHPHVQAMFDTHHANIEEKSLPAAIEHIRPVLSHVHLSENDRGTPGSGHVDFDSTLATLSKLNYDGWLTIEAFSRSDPEFANAINVWREFSPEWDIAESGHQFLRNAIASANFQSQ